MPDNPAQLSLNGFEKRRFFGELRKIIEFAGSFLRYLLKKVIFGLFLPVKSVRLGYTFATNAKFYLTRRLIWGRGRLTRPFSHLTIIGLTSWVFLTGGLLSGTPVVRSATDKGDILSSYDAIIQSSERTEIVPSSSSSSEPIKYTVKVGDTLTSIGAAFGVSLDTIRYANDISDSDTLSPRQELTILPVDGLKVKVEEGDTVESIAKKYQASAQAIVDFNYLDEPYTLKVAQEIIVPGGTLPSPAPTPTPSYSVPYAYQPQIQVAPSGTGQFRWPCDTSLITQYFSYYHPALDISPYSLIYSADTGTVVRAGWWPQGYGNAIEIDHGNGYTTTYAHLNRIDVFVGQQVGKGQIIGEMGNTGRSFGEHLHFVIQYFGQYVNPLSFF